MRRLALTLATKTLMWTANVGGGLGSTESNRTAITLDTNGNGTDNRTYLWQGIRNGSYYNYGSQWYSIPGTQSYTAQGTAVQPGGGNVFSPGVAAFNTGSGQAPYIYVMGGEVSGGSGSSTSYRFSYGANAWLSRTALPAARMRHTAGWTGGCLYVIGGYSGSTISTAVYSQPTETSGTGGWSSLAMPNGGSESHGSDVYNGYMWIAGGERNGVWSTTTYMLDGAAGTFTAKAASPNCRYSTFTSLGDGKFVMFGGEGLGGGYSVTGRTTIYDSVTNTWAAGPTALQARSHHAAAFLNGAMFVFGGVDQFGASLATIDQLS